MSQKPAVCPTAVRQSFSTSCLVYLQDSQPQDVQEATEKLSPESAVHMNRKVLQILCYINMQGMPHSCRLLEGCKRDKNTLCLPAFMNRPRTSALGQQWLNTEYKGLYLTLGVVL